MKTKFFYIHGLGSSKNSGKFLELKNQFENIECLDWTTNDDMNQKLDKWSKQITAALLTNDNICIIASSTGANFAYQLRLRNPIIFLHLVLVNPLFDVDYIYDSSIMPENIKRYLTKVDNLSGSLILIGNKDTVVNCKGYLKNNPYVNSNNQIIIDNESTHKFENLNLYYSEINDLINSIYL